VKKKFFYAAVGIVAVVVFLLGSCGLFDKSTAELYWSGNESPAGLMGSAVVDIPEDGGDIPRPRLTRNMRKYRMAVVVSGDYWEYFDNIKGLISGFSNVGWANQVDIPESISSCALLLEWLSRTDYSKYVEFPLDLYFDLQWGESMDACEEALINNIPDADAVLVYGTVAAKRFYQLDAYPLPCIADGITDCLAAGVTVSFTDSGKDFFTNRIDPEIFRKQIRLFHELTDFNRLGIIYADDEVGIVYGAVRDVEAIAEEIGFEIVRDTDVTEDVGPDTVERFLNALRNIAPRCDAVYFGASTAIVEYNIIPDINEILDLYKIPSFSQEGTIRVKEGILYSLSSSGIIRNGIYTASKIARIFAGESVRAQPQVLENIPDVSVNLVTAEKIGYSVPLDVIVNSDEIYLTRDGSPPVRPLSIGNVRSEWMDYTAAYRGLNSGFLRGQNSYQPRYRSDGRRFRIAILESGPYWEYNDAIRGLLQGLASLGWIRSSELYESGITESPSIGELISTVESDYLTFSGADHVDLSWGENSGAAQRFFQSERPDVDLIIALGSVAANMFKNYTRYPIPVLMEGITDPVGGGYIQSASDSGRDFVTCRLDPMLYQRQVQLFYQFTGFKKLGIVYGNDDYGRLYSAVNDVETAGRELGFEIVRNTNVTENVGPDTVSRYLAALRDVASRSDAVYIGASTAIVEYDIMNEVTAILNEAKVPSFALEGEIRVRDGIMLGISSIAIEKIGLYNARKTAAILLGVLPRDLPQQLEGLPSVVLNLDTVQKIGIPLPLSILSTVDQMLTVQNKQE
jgi:ABC-type uncharacterized transport system substrate-binding protein